MTDSPVSVMKKMAAGAVIGTDRSGAKPEAVLTLAAVLGLRARAGWRARACSGSIAECPADSRPVAPEAAMGTLLRLMGNPDGGVIEEWAELAKAAGVRIADSTVPVVMDWWSRQPRRSEVVYSVLGKRGEWLASLNEAWVKPVAASEVPTNADELWQTGKTPERVALLLTLRRHDPARGLAMVQSTWASDGADERRRFVEMLLQGRSMADEPFLETTLDDKSKLVRRQACAVLGAIAGSRYRARMNERAKAIITVDGNRGRLKKGVKVALSPPADFDKSWERDGIDEQAASGIGKRAWWMRQILMAADLSVWTDVTGLEPAAVLDAIKDDDYFKDALTALTETAYAAGQPDWSAALVRQLLDHRKLDPVAIQNLCAHLPPSRREELLLEAADHKKLTGPDRWSLMASSKDRWSPEFSRKALKLLVKNRAHGSAAYVLYEPVERVSRVVAVEAADQFEETVNEMFADQPTDSFKRSIDRVRLRADMHKEFAT